MNVARRPCNEFAKHERGRDDNEEKQKWHNMEIAPAYYHLRWMGEVAVRREHLVRMIRDLDAEGEVGVNDNLEDCLVNYVGCL